MRDFRDIQKSNRRRTAVLLAASAVLLGLVGGLAGLMIDPSAPAGIVGVVLAMGLTALLYFQSAALALGQTRAKPADPREHRRLHNLVEGVALAAGVPKPRVYVIDDPAPNAFAAGIKPEKATVAVTTGLMEKLNRRELEAVVAHEMAHIRNLDIRVMTVAVATAGSIALIADIAWRALWWGNINGGRSRRSSNNKEGGNPIVIIGFIVVTILAPIAAGLLRAAISRSRESLADATAIEFTRNPGALRTALQKLQADVTVVRRTSHATSHLWIESPDDHVKKHKGARFNSMYNTHPPLSERISALWAMEGGVGPIPALEAERKVEVGSKQEDGSADGGWFEDPLGEGLFRWWDGDQWTEHTSGAG